MATTRKAISSMPQEWRDQVSERVSAYYADPTNRERQRQIQRQIYDPNTPEGRANRAKVAAGVRAANERKRRALAALEAQERATLDAILAANPEGGEQA